MATDWNRLTEIIHMPGRDLLFANHFACELISRVLEKIERIHNMPRKAEHLSFQGKKDFENRSMGYRRLG